MTLARTTVVPGYQQELRDFSELLRSLDADEWQRPTRCEGWTVADVAAHVVGVLTDVANGVLEGLATPEATARHLGDRKGRSAGEVADELDQSAKVGADILAAFDDTLWDMPAPGDYDGSLGSGIITLWYDTYVHADDIRVAVGRETVGGPGVVAAIDHVAEQLAKQGWGPATLALDGMPEFPVGSGDGPRVTGDPHTFVLIATGRADPSLLGLDPTVNIYREA
jgi:uncharacterized protein (TIGR03083 family)